MYRKITNWLKLRRLKKEKALNGTSNWVSLIEKAKHGEPVLIDFKKDYTGGFSEIYLRSEHRGHIHHSSILLIFSENTMLIGDVKVLESSPYSGRYSRGYGTLLMKLALEEAKQRGVKIITGNMAGSGPEQRERQINYYTKFGFTIDSNNKLHKKM